MNLYERVNDKVDIDLKIENRTIQLLKDSEFHPFHPDNFTEVVIEMDRDVLRDVCESLQLGRFERAGILLKEQANQLFQARALKEAKRQIDCEIADMCPRCLDSGCIKCEGQ